MRPNNKYIFKKRKIISPKKGLGKQELGKKKNYVNNWDLFCFFYKGKEKEYGQLALEGH